MGCVTSEIGEFPPFWDVFRNSDNIHRQEKSAGCKILFPVHGGGDRCRDLTFSVRSGSCRSPESDIETTRAMTVGRLL